MAAIILEARDSSVDPLIQTSKLERNEIEALALDPDTSGWPTANYDFTQDTLITDEKCPGLSSTDAMLDIKVGGGSKARRWLVHQKLICLYSPFFSDKFAEIRDERCLVCDLPELEPKLFKLFLSWLYREPADRNKAPKSEASTWKLYSVEAYMLAKLVSQPARDFQWLCLTKVIENITDFDQLDVEYIYAQEGDDPNSPIRELCRHWVRWRKLQDKFIWSTTKSNQLKYDMSSKFLNDDRDPRLYQPEHWVRCFLFSGTCYHFVQRTTDSKPQPQPRVSRMPTLSRVLFKLRERPPPWEYLLPAVKDTMANQEEKRKLARAEEIEGIRRARMQGLIQFP